MDQLDSPNYTNTQTLTARNATQCTLLRQKKSLLFMWSQDRVLYICTHMDHETTASKLVMELKPGVE